MTGWPDLFGRVGTTQQKKYGAGNGVRTRDPQLGRLMLCQLSYSRPLTIHRLLSLMRRGLRT